MTEKWLVMADSVAYDDSNYYTGDGGSPSGSIVVNSLARARSRDIRELVFKQSDYRDIDIDQFEGLDDLYPCSEDPADKTTRFTDQELTIGMYYDRSISANKDLLLDRFINIYEVEVEE